MGKQRMQWYLHDRLGMFIHWGIYSAYGHGEWARSQEKLTVEEYQPNFDSFDPKDFRPTEWARLAREAGMRYAVLTSKHHDGFCLFDSRYTDYKSTNTPFGRDAVREFLDAFRAQGLKVGLYYSLLDWHHPDYPRFGDRHAPLRDIPPAPGEERSFDRYLTYLYNQVEELCANYGKLDLFWFDFSYDDLCGEAWQASRLVEMMRRYQPDIILNNRLEGSGGDFGSLVTGRPTSYSGDFVTPEQEIPPRGITDGRGNPVPWEACITTNDHWGFCKDDFVFKSGDVLIRKLVECVSKGGNLIINVGPDGDGRIPEQSAKALKELGAWLSQNGDSIYGCGNAAIDKPEFGRITGNGNRLYFHIMEPVIGPIPLAGLARNRIQKIKLLEEGRELPLSNSWAISSYPDVAFTYYGENGDFTYPLPNQTDTVLEVTLKD